MWTSIKSNAIFKPVQSFERVTNQNQQAKMVFDVSRTPRMSETILIEMQAGWLSCSLSQRNVLRNIYAGIEQRTFMLM